MHCPACGATVQTFRNPVPTVDIIIETAGGVVLIERKNPPHGWALPGGFVKVFGWHDNEVAYAARLVELVRDLAERITRSP